MRSAPPRTHARAITITRMNTNTGPDSLTRERGHFLQREKELRAARNEGKCRKLTISEGEWVAAQALMSFLPALMLMEQSQEEIEGDDTMTEENALHISPEMHLS